MGRNILLAEICLCVLPFGFARGGGLVEPSAVAAVADGAAKRAAPRSASATDGVEAISTPSKDVTLSFVRPGRVAKILVKDGQTVAAGELLIQQDDLAEQAQLEQIKAQAADETRVKAAEAQLAQKDVDLKRMTEMTARGAATETELEHARLDKTIAELSLALARFQRAQDQRKSEEFRLQLDRMRMTSPIAGRVERVFVEAGESVDALEDVVRVVQVDPLWVHVPAPLGIARGLKVGSVAEVSFAGEGASPVAGRIIHIASIADAASDTLTVRVEVPNATGRPAGERVSVSFASSTATGAAPEDQPATARQPRQAREKGHGQSATTGTQPPPEASGRRHDGA